MHKLSLAVILTIGTLLISAVGITYLIENYGTTADPASTIANMHKQCEAKGGRLYVPFDGRSKPVVCAKELP